MDTPIACSLSAAAYAQRRAQTAVLVRGALRDRHPIPGGERLRFHAGDGVERRLREVVAAEAACCPFLTVELRRDGDALRLDVTGPDEARPIVAELFAV